MYKREAMNKKICIIDDDNSILTSLDRMLMKEGYTVTVFSSSKIFLEQVPIIEPAVAIIDINLGEGQVQGAELTKILKEEFPNIQSVVISGESDIQKTLECVKNGAFDFIEKPVSLPRLITTVKNACSGYNAKTTLQAGHNILGNSPAITKLKSKLKKLASLNENVLIVGESGTGKELVAESLHYYSNRYTMPLYKVNCTALNPNLVESELFGHTKGSFTGANDDKKGLFELASGGSFFLDEIGDFDLHLQSKLLRVIQEKKIASVGQANEIAIDTRLVFATHCDLHKMVEHKQFREDLFFRISTFILEVPALRERLEDIQVLAEYFLHNFVLDNKFTYKEFAPNAFAKLMEYSYPGNIRELISIIKNAVIFSEKDIIDADDISFNQKVTNTEIWEFVKERPLNESKEWFEKELILKRLRYFNNDLEETAESLGVVKNNLYRKLRSFDINWK